MKELSTSELEAELARRRRLAEYYDKIAGLGTRTTRPVAHSVRHVRGAGVEVCVVSTSEIVTIRSRSELEAARIAYLAACELLGVEP